MILKLVIHMIIIISVIITWPIHHLQASAQYSRAKHGCDSQCGGVDIPYPFGMNASKCYAGKWFEIECRNNGSKHFYPYLKSIEVEVISIDVSEGTVRIKNPIYRSNCGTKPVNNISLEGSPFIYFNQVPYLKSIEVKVISIDVSGGMVQINNPVSRTNCGTKHPARPVNISLEGSPFVYSQGQNKFVAVGCNKIAFLQLNGSDVSGCVSICDNDKDDIGNIDLGSTECHGKSCCETSLPLYLSEYTTEIKGLNQNQTGHDCSYAMIVEDRYYSSYYGGGDLKDLYEVPAALEREIINNLTLPADDHAYCRDTNITSSRYKRSGRRCYCNYDAYGTGAVNPYIAGGCPATSLDFISTSGAWAILGVSASVGSIILLLVLWLLYNVVRKHIVLKRKENFFKKNGGLLLEQRLSSGEVNDDKVKLFSLKDLEKATDHFNKNRVLGKGGQGTVYKGMLIDGKIIAVKKFKVEGNVEEFINEFVILSQINHRNVVKLLGSCLETEIPLLVYEFIPNGNLFEYLHEQNEDLPMTWDMRLRIATEVAGALFYLHSAASRPIYHRDIKTTNILLDEKYRAKVADFGTSRMVTIEATHLTTVVQGTFGYLDPEYFQTSQFTEKSDVYSFGVVLVELLTGQKPISLLRPVEAKSLASYFILCMEENRLFEIIDERVVKEGEKEHIMAVANLASRCLELNGKKRPTMKEVTLELEGIRKLEGKSDAQERHELVRVEDYQSWAEYSTTSNIRSTLDLTSRTPTLEDIHILTI